MSIRPLARSVLLATLGLACALAAGCGGEIPGAAFGPGMDGSFPVPGDAPADGAADASVLGDASDGELLPGELPLPPVDADRDRGVELPDTPLADTQEDPPPGPPPDSDGDGTPDPLDCAPLDPRIHPDAEEVCNLLDDDCDGETDEDQGNLFCGIGECLAIVPACQAGAPGSCVPLPSTAELCNGLDDDCDGSTDEDIPDLTCGQGPCTATVPGCTDQGVPKCVPLDVAGPEVCNGVDDDCDGLTDNGLPDLGCGLGPCATSVAACVDGVPGTCTPLPVPPGTCNAPPAACKTTTTGADACGNPCSKTGPAKCFTVHPACFTSGPGTPTDAPTCTTPKGNYNCGLTCQAWPNTIGADCTYCVNIHCKQKNGLDEAQFQCANIPIPPTP